MPWRWPFLVTNITVFKLTSSLSSFQRPWHQVLMFKFFNLHLAIYLHAKTKTRQQPFTHSIILFHDLLRILSNLGVYRSHNNSIFLLFLILYKYHYTEFLKKRNVDYTCYKMKFHHNKKEQTPRKENHIHSTTGKINLKKKRLLFGESGMAGR